MSHLRSFGLALALGLGIGVSLDLHTHVPQSPQEAVNEFRYSCSVAESQIMDPLILRGSDVVPLLTEELQDVNLRYRAYAILALGHLGERPALDILKAILENPLEDDEYRCVALLSIARIDRKLGRDLAHAFQQSPIRCMAQTVNEINAPKPLKRKTRWKTLFPFWD